MILQLRLLDINLVFFLGPVRGINFHANQPLFVSGGDDYKIKVGPLLCLMLYEFNNCTRLYIFKIGTCTWDILGPQL